MLLSSVLQILANSQLEEQPKPAEEAAAGFRAEVLAAAARETAGALIEEAVQSADGSVKSLASGNQPKAIPPPGPSLEGLIQMVTKLQKEDQSRFLDVFE